MTYSLHLANAGSGGFSFDCPIGQSIGELSPCVPRFCYYERDSFVSTQSRTKSQSFYAHKIVTIGYLSGFLVQIIFALTCDMSMESGYFLLHVTAAPLFAMTQPALLPCKFFLGFSEKVRIIRMSSIGIYIQFAHGKIKSDCGFYWPDFMFRFFCRIQQ